MRLFRVLALALSLAFAAPAQMVCPAPPAAVVQTVPSSNHIRFEADIDASSVAVTSAALAEAGKTAKYILLEINSGGGHVQEGFMLAKAIERSPVPIFCVVDGQASSMAFYVLQSCSVRIMTNRSVLMLHNPSGMVAGDEYVLDSKTQDLRTLGIAMATHYANRMKLAVSYIRNKMYRREWYMNWPDALHYKAVDRVVETVAEAKALAEASN